MRIDTIYRLYLNDEAYDFLTFDDAEAEQLWQAHKNHTSPIIYKVELCYVGEQYVGQHEEPVV